MTQLQDDLLEIYNSLVDFSDNTVKTNLPLPIKVWYESDGRLLVFEQKGKSVRIRYKKIRPWNYEFVSDYEYDFGNEADGE